ncbi:MAG: DNRLRE domain-containing protein [Chloroflexi bacterium]|nr:MAG: DNRLRE domain-containing protein [Chloroflexota bacterium]
MNFSGKWLVHTKMGKAKSALRMILILFLIITVSPLTACTPPISTEPLTSTAIISTTTPESNTATVSMPVVTSTVETPTPSATPASTQASDSSFTFIADADAQVSEADPSKNYGDTTYLQVDGGDDPDVESFIRFKVTGISEGIQSARLRFYNTTNASKHGPSVYATDPSWSESEITWESRPSRVSGPLDSVGSVNTDTWVEYDVTSLVSADGTFSFVLAIDSSDAATFSSRQGSQPPQLVITFGSGLTPTPTPMLTDEGVIFVGAGDISDCGNDNDELTAQLLDAIPGTVFTTGDNVYNSGTSEQFANCYEPTWGRHKDRTRPVPGNHDYRTEGAAGYFQYFNNVPSYYAYDLGGWRIYALNSEIDVSETSEQVIWLQSDLAANPRQCVLAYWHQPRWSSGDNHGSDRKYQTVWQIFYEASAELVLNGHEHSYERFAPMNAAGEIDPLGLREFVVGMGGRDHYDFGTILPASEVQDNTSYGVLKLVLRPTGYDWEFVPAAGSTFTDSGSADCH